MHLFDLFEAIRPSVLYHGTSPDNAAEILSTNIILANTDHIVMKLNGDIKSRFSPKEVNPSYGTVNGISLSRDPLFAKRWTSGWGVVLVFDANSLRHRFKMVPYNYYGNRSESEEFLIGSIDPVNKYLTQILISNTVYQELVACDEIYLEGHKPYQKLLNHRLLKIEGQKWHGLTGRNISS